MSSLKDLASLIMIPSLYEDGELHTVKPLADENIIVHPDATDNNDGVDGSTPSTSSNFTFSRGSNLAATRVDVNGLIEKGRENLLLQSNQFDTTWNTTRSTFVGGQSGYDGSNNAWAFVNTTDNNTHLSVQSFGYGPSIATFSIYAKAGDVNFLAVRFEGNTGVDYSFFDLGNGTLGNIDADYIDAKIESVGNGWYRCSGTKSLPNIPDNQLVLLSAQTNGDPTYAGAGTTAIYIQDAQVELGLVATDYIETGATSVSAGILEDMPRLDYSGSCPALLLEPQRTNLLTHSEYFGASGWNKLSVNLTANNAESPQGKQNAYLFVPTSSGGQIYDSIGKSASSIKYTASVFVKAKELTSLRMYVHGTSNANRGDASFNLSTESATYSNFGTFTETFADIEDYGNDWYRCILTTKTDTSTGLQLVIRYDGTTNSSDALYIYGAQLEAASYPTSYIPTMGASVTRSVDAMSLTDLLGNDIVNTLTEGTLLLDLEVSGTRDSAASYRHFRMVDNTDSSTNRIRLWEGGAGTISTLRVDFTSGHIEEGITPDTQNKLAVSWGSSGTKIYKNGVNTDSSTSQLVFASTPKFLTSIVSNYRFNSILVFPTALTDSECIALTTL